MKGEPINYNDLIYKILKCRSKSWNLKEIDNIYHQKFKIESKAAQNVFPHYVKNITARQFLMKQGFENQMQKEQHQKRLRLQKQKNVQSYYGYLLQN